MIQKNNFSFLKAETYTYYGTSMDNMDHLNYNTAHLTGDMTARAAQMAGRMALRLTHNHLLSLDVSRYRKDLSKAINVLYVHVRKLVQVRRFM